jgi:membrane-associated protein
MAAMDIASFLLDFVLHVDRHLGVFAHDHGAWVYALLFAVVFVETGLVVMPFLPGDSMLFVVGTLCGAGSMSWPVAAGVLLAAAIAGDQVNYTAGRALGPKVLRWEHSRWFDRRAFDAAHGFYERHGGITVVLARFMPFIRTFAPFVAGVAAMGHARFTAYNVAGALAWVLGLTAAGHAFGQRPFVQQHLSQLIWALILVPGLIAAFGGWKARRVARDIDGEGDAKTAAR